MSPFENFLLIITLVIALICIIAVAVKRGLILILALLPALFMHGCSFAIDNFARSFGGREFTGKMAALIGSSYFMIIISFIIIKGMKQKSSSSTNQNPYLK